MVFPSVSVFELRLTERLMAVHTSTRTLDIATLPDASVAVTLMVKVPVVVGLYTQVELVLSA